MTAVAFDTHRIVKRLRSAGFTEEQAEAVTDAVQDATTLDVSRLATKEQVQLTAARLEERMDQTTVRLEERMDQTTVRLEERMDLTTARLEERMDRIEERLGSTAARLEERIGLTAARLEERIDRRAAEQDAKSQAFRNELIKWVIGTGIAAVLTLGGLIGGAVVTILRALPAVHP